MNGNRNNFRMTREEREFAELSRHLDIEVFALELEHSLVGGVREASDRRQAGFDRMMEGHPRAVAERERWRKNREESERRMARLQAERQVIPAQQAAMQLARCWGVKLVS